MEVAAIRDRWASGQACRAGWAIYEAIPGPLRPAWAGDILDLACSRLARVKFAPRKARTAMKQLCFLLVCCFLLAAALSAGLPSHAKPLDPPKHFTNDIGIKFVWVPPGTFIMGSPDDEKGRNKNESQHKVRLTKGFYLGVATVTKGQWRALMDQGAAVPKRDRDLPMETVSWDDCQEFIKKLRAKDGRSYRLPTEAEWEYACRAGTTTSYYFGNTLSAKDANFGKGMKGASKLATTPVARYPANPWGLHDMHGNVWQWCQDWFGDYPEKEVVDPQGPERGKERVLRGGSFTDIAQNCRSATRHKFEPNGRDHIVGFRVCFFME